ncbi:MAG: hypothetical protein IJA41_07935 [Clostridia bacterium]|nr:hypothetical protein [Clostridia bacterium]
MEKNKRKLSVKWLIFFVLGGITVLAFIGFVTFKVLLENGINFYFVSFSSDEICGNLVALLIFSAAFTLIALLFAGFNSVIAPILISIPVLLLAAWLFIAIAFAAPSISYYTFTSPDGEHEIIFQRRQYFGGDAAEIFERTSENVMHKIGENYREQLYPSSTDFENEIKWNEHGFSIEVSDGYGKKTDLQFDFYKD